MSKVMYEVSYSVKGFMYVDAENKDEVLNEFENNLKITKNKEHILYGLVESMKNGDLHVDEIKEVF